MSIDTIFIIILIALMIIGLYFISALIASFIDSYFKTKELSKFKEDIRVALKNTQPTWQQVKVIASTHPSIQKDISGVIRELLSEALKGGR